MNHYPRHARLVFSDPIMAPVRGYGVLHYTSPADAAQKVARLAAAPVERTAAPAPLPASTRAA